MSEPKFYFLTYNPDAIQSLSSIQLNNFIKVIDAFSKWCDAPLIMKGYMMMIMTLKKASLTDIELRLKVSTGGFYILVNQENELLSIASVCGMSCISHIATNPKYRHMNYATTLLNHIEKCYNGKDTIVWSPVDNTVKNLFIKAKWVKCDDETNRDDTYDYCPSTHLKPYSIRLKKQKQNKINYKDDMLSTIDWISNILQLVDLDVLYKITV